MKTPKLYFKISKSSETLIPVNGQTEDLDNLFTNEDVISKNKENYNSFTKDFIVKNLNSNEMFWSDNYSYNSKQNTFNFNELNICDDNDYMEITTNVCKFNIKKNYNTTERSSNIKENTPQNILEEISSKYPVPNISTGFYVEDKNWNFLVRNILKHKNTMLVGPTGTGKTEIIMRICESLGIPCRVYDMGSMMDPLTDLLGSHRLGKSGESVFDYSKFVQDVQTPGVILLDELSRAPQQTNNILFPCLDCRRELPVDIADSKSNRRIKINPEVTFIATANIGQEYSGTSDLDAALTNRFTCLQVDYLPENIETSVLCVRTNIPMEYAEKIVSVANLIRQRYFEGNISKPISTRETISTAEMFVDGFDIMDAIDFGMCQKYMKYGEEQEYSVVKKIIMGF